LGDQQRRLLRALGRQLVVQHLDLRLLGLEVADQPLVGLDDLLRRDQAVDQLVEAGRGESQREVVDGSVLVDRPHPLVEETLTDVELGGAAGDVSLGHPDLAVEGVDLGLGGVHQGLGRRDLDVEAVDEGDQVVDLPDDVVDLVLDRRQLVGVGRLGALVGSVLLADVVGRRAVQRSRRGGSGATTRRRQQQGADHRGQGPLRLQSSQTLT